MCRTGGKKTERSEGRIDKGNVRAKQHRATEGHHVPASGGERSEGRKRNL